MLAVRGSKSQIFYRVSKKFASLKKKYDFQILFEIENCVKTFVIPDDEYRVLTFQETDDFGALGGGTTLPTSPNLLSCVSDASNPAHLNILNFFTKLSISELSMVKFIKNLNLQIIYFKQLLSVKTATYMAPATKYIKFSIKFSI